MIPPDALSARDIKTLVKGEQLQTTTEIDGYPIGTTVVFEEQSIGSSNCICVRLPNGEYPSGMKHGYYSWKFRRFTSCAPSMDSQWEYGKSLIGKTVSFTSDMDKRNLHVVDSVQITTDDTKSGQSMSVNEVVREQGYCVFLVCDKGSYTHPANKTYLYKKKDVVVRLNDRLNATICEEGVEIDGKMFTYKQIKNVGEHINDPYLGHKNFSLSSVMPLSSQVSEAEKLVTIGKALNISTGEVHEIIKWNITKTTGKKLGALVNEDIVRDVVCVYLSYKKDDRIHTLPVRYFKVVPDSVYVTLDYGYKVKITKTQVNVGCQNFSIDSVKNLMAQIEKYEKEA